MSEADMAEAFEKALARINSARNIREWNAAFDRALAEFDRIHQPLPIGTLPTGSTSAPHPVGTNR